jgi:hypothetical protein
MKLNITDYLIDRLYVNKSFLIGIKDKGPINLIFGGTNAPIEVSPKIVLNNFDINMATSNESSIKARLCDDQAQDYASNSNRPSPDGKEDLCISFEFKNIAGTLKNFEITYKSNFDFIWNLRDDDIYPGMVFVKNGRPFNAKDYRLLNNDIFDVYLAKPDFFENKGFLNYSISIGGKNYEDNITIHN